MDFKNASFLFRYLQQHICHAAYLIILSFSLIFIPTQSQNYASEWGSINGTKGVSGASKRSTPKENVPGRNIYQESLETKTYSEMESTRKQAHKRLLDMISLVARLDAKISRAKGGGLEGEADMQNEYWTFLRNWSRLLELEATPETLIVTVAERSINYKDRFKTELMSDFRRLSAAAVKIREAKPMIERGAESIGKLKKDAKKATERACKAENSEQAITETNQVIRDKKRANKIYEPMIIAWKEIKKEKEYFNPSRIKEMSLFNSQVNSDIKRIKKMVILYEEIEKQWADLRDDHLVPIENIYRQIGNLHSDIKFLVKKYLNNQGWAKQYNVEANALLSEAKHRHESFYLPHDDMVREKFAHYKSLKGFLGRKTLETFLKELSLFHNNMFLLMRTTLTIKKKGNAAYEDRREIRDFVEKAKACVKKISIAKPQLPSTWTWEANCSSGKHKGKYKGGWTITAIDAQGNFSGKFTGSAHPGSIRGEVKGSSVRFVRTWSNRRQVWKGTLKGKKISGTLTDNIHSKCSFKATAK